MKKEDCGKCDFLDFKTNECEDQDKSILKISTCEVINVGKPLYSKIYMNHQKLLKVFKELLGDYATLACDYEASGDLDSEYDTDKWVKLYYYFTNREGKCAC